MPSAETPVLPASEAVDSMKKLRVFKEAAVRSMARNIIGVVESEFGTDYLEFLVEECDHRLRLFRREAHDSLGNSTNQ